MKKFILMLTIFTTVSIASFSQNVLDGVYVKENNPARRVIPYTYLREADVMWAKRMWRHIDLNEKINAPLRYPKTGDTKDRKNLINVFMDAVKEGSLTAYDPQDDEFVLPMTLDEFSKVGGADSLQIKVTRAEPPYDEYDSTVFRPFNPDDVIQYRLKEEWFFDKQRSELKCRIIGICPMILARDQEGNLIEGGQADKRNSYSGYTIRKHDESLRMQKWPIASIQHNGCHLRISSRRGCSTAISLKRTMSITAG
jgi:gliding motility associated protien GldN